MPKRKNLQSINMQMPIELYEKLKLYAGTHNCTQAHIITMATNMYIDAMIRTDQEQLELFRKTALEEAEAKAKAETEGQK